MDNFISEDNSIIIVDGEVFLGERGLFAATMAAGGRLFTGMSERDTAFIKDELKKNIKTEADRDEAIEFINKTIKQTKTMTWSQIIGGLIAFNWVILVVGRLIGTASNGDERKKHADALAKLRTEIKNMKL